MTTYDVAVLGAGPGGYEAAIRCAQYGLKTALIEAKELGGTCLNRGCIPTKALLQGAQVLETVQKAEFYGISAGEIQLDYKKLAAYKDQVVSRLVGGIEALEKAHGVVVYRGFGILEGAHTLRIGEESIEAEKIILATGSRPAVPPVPGADGRNVWSSDDVLSMERLPESIIIIGGGVIGIEFATLFSGLGRPVTVIEMMDAILPGVDRQIVRQLERNLKRRGVRIVTGARVEEIQGGSVLFVQKEKPQQVSAEVCVICTGRKPCTEGIGLDRAGVRNDRGYICVDDRMRTNVPGIYAIGDITGKIQLAHAATAQGLTAAADCAGKTEKMQYSRIPACIYTEPEIAYVGMTEEKAIEEGYQVKTGTFSVSANGKSAIMGVQSGMAKLISDGESGKILGAQIMAPHATDMIAEIALAMGLNGTMRDIAATVHPHPTVSEILMESAWESEGLCCNTVPSARK